MYTIAHNSTVYKHTHNRTPFKQAHTHKLTDTHMYAITHTHTPYVLMPEQKYTRVPSKRWMVRTGSPGRTSVPLAPCFSWFLVNTNTLQLFVPRQAEGWWHEQVCAHGQQAKRNDTGRRLVAERMCAHGQQHVKAPTISLTCAEGRCISYGVH